MYPQISFFKELDAYIVRKNSFDFYFKVSGKNISGRIWQSGEKQWRCIVEDKETTATRQGYIGETKKEVVEKTKDFMKLFGFKEKEDIVTPKEEYFFTSLRKAIKKYMEKQKRDESIRSFYNKILESKGPLSILKAILTEYGAEVSLLDIDWIITLRIKKEGEILLIDEMSLYDYDSYLEIEKIYDFVKRRKKELELNSEKNV